MKASPWLMPRLGVNIDHIATLRQLRGTPYPDLLEAAVLVKKAGAHQITIHLREDRRHIQDADVVALKKKGGLPLNLECALAPAMLKIALKVKPDWVCLVPEKRQELTTEGGLAVKKHARAIEQAIRAFRKKGIRVSLFIEPEVSVVRLSKELGADAVELHTGRYCNATQKAFGRASAKIARSEFKRIVEAVKAGNEAGIHVHAGHGFDYRNVRKVVALDMIEEFNIGHAIVCRAALVGLEQAVREMVSAIQAP